MILASSNLSVSTIIQALGVASAKAIFYNGDGSLKSAAQLEYVVNKNGLSSYCPGSTADEKLANLRANRNLSYFKGYNTSYNSLETSTSSIVLGGFSTSSQTFTITSNVSWTITRSSTTYMTVTPSSGSGNATITVRAALKNDSGYTRQCGSLTIEGGGISRYISVTQVSM
jgi:hypothetical protein